MKASYRDNASYAEDGSAAKANAFITACSFLLEQRPKRAAHGGRGTEFELDPGVIERQQQRASRWLAANAGVTAGGAGIRHVDVRRFRE